MLLICDLDVAGTCNNGDNSKLFGARLRYRGTTDRWPPHHDARLPRFGAHATQTSRYLPPGVFQHTGKIKIPSYFRRIGHCQELVGGNSGLFNKFIWYSAQFQSGIVFFSFIWNTTWNLRGTGCWRWWTQLRLSCGSEHRWLIPLIRPIQVMLRRSCLGVMVSS